jgi:hypothetical protein
VARELGVEAVVVERKDGRGDGDGVQQDRQARVLGGVEDRVVAAMAPERVQSGARQVDGDGRGIVGVALDLARGVLGILRARDDRPEQRRVL